VNKKPGMNKKKKASLHWIAWY